MDVLLAHNLTLTSSRPSSSGSGGPVVVDVRTGAVAGPQDIVVAHMECGELYATAAHIVAMVGREATDRRVRQMARRFCSQWREGPQP